MKLGIAWSALLLLLSPISRLEAAEPSPNDVLRAAAKIVTPDGIDIGQMVPIGGINQWISIRGRHRDNPILLVLHGGPGFTTIPSSYYFLKDWEEYFTVVQWDQRGAGKTYLANDPSKVKATVSLDHLVADAEELVSYLRKTYDRKRIVLLAHSFGTVTGVKLAQLRPDWFFVYVAMGQLVDAPLNEKMSYDGTLAAARADHNEKAVSELESIVPYPDLAHPERDLQNLAKERRWLAYYGGVYWRDNVGHEDALDQFSPDYTADELKARYEGMNFGIQALWGEAGHVDFRPITHFACPVIFMEGRHDLATSATLVDQWFKTIQAPKKELVWFADSAHMVYQEEPGKVLVTLVNEVLPLTRR